MLSVEDHIQRIGVQNFQPIHSLIPITPNVGSPILSPLMSYYEIVRQLHKAGEVRDSSCLTLFHHHTAVTMLGDVAYLTTYYPEWQERFRLDVLCSLMEREDVPHEALCALNQVLAGFKIERPNSLLELAKERAFSFIGIPRIIEQYRCTGCIETLGPTGFEVGKVYKLPQIMTIADILIENQVTSSNIKK